MNLFRTVVAVVGSLLMVVGYAASQVAFFSGTTKDYSLKVESSAIPMVSLLILVAALVLGFLPGGESEEADGKQ